MSKLGLSKKESYKIFRENISCMDYFFGNYLSLNKALDEVSKEKIEKNNLCSRISELTVNIKNNFILEAMQKNPELFDTNNDFC